MKVSRGNHLLQILSAPETMLFNYLLVSLGISGAIVNTKYEFFLNPPKKSPIHYQYQDCHRNEVIIIILHNPRSEKEIFL